MNRPAIRPADVVGAIAVVVVLAIFLALPSFALAQQAPPPAEIPKPAPGLPPGYVGTEVCKACHGDLDVEFARTKMGRLFLHQPRNNAERLACETCHGPGVEHVNAGGLQPGGMITFGKKDRTPIDKRNEVCLSCHTKGARVFWQGSSHEARNVACTSCHRVMREVAGRAQLVKGNEIDTCGTCHIQKRAQQMRVSHMPLREGKMTCTSCHNPHGTVTPALLKENSVNDTCYTCHTEKRGPFLWEHAPVVESCTNCHDPHGSNHERMLKLARPRLCQQCHIETRHPTNPYGRDTASLKFVLGRQCANCHINIHGSNHPSGFAFTR